MLTKERYLHLHSKFYDLLDEENVWFQKLLSFDDYRIPSTIAQGPSWMIFHTIAVSQTDELLNSLNDFCTRSRRLEVWSVIFNEIDNENDQFEVLIEMLEPVFRLTMDYPAALRSSLIFVSSILLRETARLLRFSFKDFEEKTIRYKTLEGFRSLAETRSWESFDMFLQKLNEVNSESFVKQTQNYRNRFHHRVGPALEIGLLLTVVRQKGDGKLSYEFGVEYPLKLSNAMPLLAAEYDACVGAFQGILDACK